MEIKKKIKGAEITISAEDIPEEFLLEWALRGVHAALVAAVNSAAEEEVPAKLERALQDISAGRIRAFSRGAAAVERLRQEALERVPGLSAEVAAMLDAAALKRLLAGVASADEGEDEDAESEDAESIEDAVSAAAEDAESAESEDAGED